MGPEKLLLKISLGKKLTERELEDTKDALERIRPKDLSKAGLMDDAFALVHLTAKAGLKQYAYLIEPYLEAKDSLLVSLVLETLCLEWKNSESYIERAIDFSLGAGWDEDGDVRQAALKILGEYLREKLADKPSALAEKPKRVLELLLGILSDEDLEHDNRQSAYCALARASGKDWQELPSEFEILDFGEGSEKIDAAMLDALRKLSEAESAMPTAPRRSPHSPTHRSRP